MQNLKINPNRERAKVDAYERKNLADQAKMYPRFLTSIELNQFRHIDNLHVNFVNPITVISGSNCSGKTSILMAIACSHYHFMRRNVVTGVFERARWGNMMRFTQSDVQTRLWTYHISYRDGAMPPVTKRGQHTLAGKWNGVAKKEGQIGTPPRHGADNGRRVYMIDVNRVNPGRHLTQSKFNAARNRAGNTLPQHRLVNAYVSHIFEKNYSVKGMLQAADSQIYEFNNANRYSSFNTASGEDVVMAMLTDIINAEENSLILIDEIEIGLHPKLQRRLMDVLYRLSRFQKKQFVITTHSYAVLDSVAPSSRVFIETNMGRFRVIAHPTTEEILTRMDQVRYPVTSVYVEDLEAKRIVEKAVEDLNAANPGFARLLTIVDIGSADKTFNYFKSRNEKGAMDHFERKAVCILDGDMSMKTNADGSRKYEDPAGNLFFLHTNQAPEKMLVEKYIATHPNETIAYHLANSDPHILFAKMVEEGIAASKSQAIEMCLPEYISSPDGALHFQDLKNFLEATCRL